MIRRLLRILGRRTMLVFGLVTFLVGALLATVNLTSRYALKLYVDDQLRRIPWDLAVYQQGAVNGDRSLAAHIARQRGVTRVVDDRQERALRLQVPKRQEKTKWQFQIALSVAANSV